MSTVESELSEKLKFSETFTKYVYELMARAGDKGLAEFCEMRKFPLDVVKEQKIFYIDNETELLLPNYIDYVEDFGVISPNNRRPIFHQRYIMPIFDQDGNVLNLVGYNKDADERYVYGTARYYRRKETLYGLENLNLAYKLGYAIVTEGITDTIRVRSLGYKNCFAMCGTHEASAIMRVLDRCENGVIKIPDRDAPGQKAVKGWECYRGIIMNIFIGYKDIDEMCREPDNIDWVAECLDDCISKIKLTKHNGIKSTCEIVTMT